jgi:hypothetical protein
VFTGIHRHIHTEEEKKDKSERHIDK